MKNILLTIAKYGISFAILGYLFYQTQQTDQFQALAESEKQYGWLVLALIVGISACILGFYRWYLLVRALDLDFKFHDAVRLGFFGHFLNMASIGVVGGDALKSVFLVRLMPGHGAEAVASVFFDRAIGMLAMFTMASGAYLLTDFTSSGLLHESANYAFHFVCRTAVVLTIIGYVGLGFLFLAPWFRQTALYHRIGALPKVGWLFKRLVGVVLTYRKRFDVVVVAFVLSLIFNVMVAITIFLIASGISGSHPTLGQHLVIGPISMVANAVPLPGGMGGMESAMHYLYLGISNDSLPGFVVAMGLRVIFIITAGIGMVYFFAGKREIKELSKTQLADTSLKPDPS